MVQLLQYECPPRPAHPALTDGLWSLMRCCWNRDSGSRPEAPKVLQILTLSVCELFINQSFATQERIRLITTENNQVLMVGRVESIRLVTTLFSDNDQAKVAGRVSCDNAQIIINVIDEVCPCTISLSKDKAVHFDSNPLALLLRYWMTLYQRHAGDVCGFYTRSVAVKSSFRNR